MNLIHIDVIISLFWLSNIKLYTRVWGISNVFSGGDMKKNLNFTNVLYVFFVVLIIMQIVSGSLLFVRTDLRSSPIILLANTVISAVLIAILIEIKCRLQKLATIFEKIVIFLGICINSLFILWLIVAWRLVLG